MKWGVIDVAQESGADRSHRSVIQQGAEKVLCAIRRTDGGFPG